MNGHTKKENPDFLLDSSSTHTRKLLQETKNAGHVASTAAEEVPHSAPSCCFSIETYHNHPRHLRAASKAISDELYQHC